METQEQGEYQATNRTPTPRPKHTLRTVNKTFPFFKQPLVVSKNKDRIVFDVVVCVFICVFWSYDKGEGKDRKRIRYIADMGGRGCLIWEVSNLQIN